MGDKKYKPRDPRIVSYNMSRISGKNTKPELLLRKALWNGGLRYRTHFDLPGKPDIVFLKHKVAVFCDGRFWHGKDFDKTKQELKRNKKFWIKKISDNIERDKTTNYVLRGMGWKVLRFWDNEIMRNTEDCVKKVKKAVGKE